MKLQSLSLVPAQQPLSTTTQGKDGICHSYADDAIVDYSQHYCGKHCGSHSDCNTASVAIDVKDVSQESESASATLSASPEELSTSKLSGRCNKKKKSQKCVISESRALPKLYLKTLFETCRPEHVDC